MEQYKQLTDIVESYMDKESLNIIQQESLDLPPNYKVDVRLFTHCNCDESTFRQYEGYLMKDKSLENGDVLVTLYCGDMQFTSKGKTLELIGCNVPKHRVNEFPAVIEKSLSNQLLVKDLNPKMGYTISVRYQEGQSGYLDMQLAKEIGEKAFGEKYSRYKGSYNPDMVHEWR